MTELYTTSVERLARLHSVRLSDFSDEDLLDTREVAEILGVSIGWLTNRRLKTANRLSGGPPFIKLHRHAVRYQVGQLRRWLEDQAA